MGVNITSDAGALLLRKIEWEGGINIFSASEELYQR